MNPFDVKLWVNQFGVKETRVVFVIKNSLPQSNNFKIQHIIKVEQILKSYRLQLFWKNFILDAWLGSEHVFDYPRVFFYYCQLKLPLWTFQASL